MTLWKRDQENFEKGMIYGVISMCRDLGLSDREIAKKLQEKFALSGEEADAYLQTETV